MNIKPNKEKGSALLVSLILILVSTMMGITAMQLSDVGNQLVNNNKYTEMTFRTAEAASEKLLTVENLVILAAGNSAMVTSTDSIDSNVSVDAQISPFGEGPATGYSLGGQNGFKSVKFVAFASASMDNVESTSDVVQGVERLSLARER